MDFFAIKTNAQLIDFVSNNIVLIYALKYCVEYVCAKTPWAIDDDLPSFFSGLVDIAKRKND